MQIENSVLDQITRNVLDVFNKVGETREEMIRKVHDVVREGVEHFDLVSREEFDAAAELLSNTRIKVEALEKQVSELGSPIGKIIPTHRVSFFARYIEPPKCVIMQHLMLSVF